jgi:DNA-binding transcriptional ArsR family regulator
VKPKSRERGRETPPKKAASQPARDTNPNEKEPDALDPVWKALSDPTRRAILDLLRDQPRTTTEIVDTFPHLTRFGVMKHIEALRDSGLVHTREEGRQRVNSLNVFPIRQIYERWVSPFQEVWASQLLGIKELAEEAVAQENAGHPAGKKSKPKQKS